jgi:hypothetical protein
MEIVSSNREFDFCIVHIFSPQSSEWHLVSFAIPYCAPPFVILTRAE